LQEISGKFEEGRLLVDKILIEATAIKNNIVNFLADAKKAEATGNAISKPGGAAAALAGLMAVAAIR
jgi:hypothetical protein